MLKLDNLPPILTLSEVALILRYNKLTIKKWEKKGKIKPIRINSRGDRRYFREDILQMING